MSNIGTIIASKNEKRGNKQVEALTTGFQRREQERERSQHRQAGNNHRANVPFFDGTDHINLWDRGETQIGRALSMETDINLYVEGLGRFRSFYALWVYLTTKRRTAAIRTAPAFQLRKMARDRREQDNFVEEPNTRWIILNALADYITADKAMADALILTDGVPLLSYVVANGQRSQHSQSKWWVPFVQYIRTALVGGLEINDEYLSMAKETPGTYKEIVSKFRLESNQLGRINRVSEVPGVKTPRGDKKQKPVKVQREEKPENNRQDKILGYMRIDLESEFARSDNKEVIVIKPITDAVDRRTFMWNVIGMDHTSATEYLDSFPDGDFNVPAQYVYVFFDVATAKCVRTSTDLIESPFEGDLEKTIDMADPEDAQMLASMSSVLSLAGMIDSIRQELHGDKKRLELRARKDGHYWRVSRHPDAITRFAETGSSNTVDNLTFVNHNGEAIKPESTFQEVIDQTQARSASTLNDSVQELVEFAESIDSVQYPSASISETEEQK